MGGYAIERVRNLNQDTRNHHGNESEHRILGDDQGNARFRGQSRIGNPSEIHPIQHRRQVATRQGQGGPARLHVGGDLMLGHNPIDHHLRHPLDDDDEDGPEHWPDLSQQQQQVGEDRIVAEGKLQLEAAGRPDRVGHGHIGQGIHDRLGCRHRNHRPHEQREMQAALKHWVLRVSLPAR